LASPGRAAAIEEAKKGKNAVEVLHLLFQKLGIDHAAFGQMKPEI